MDLQSKLHNAIEGLEKYVDKYKESMKYYGTLEKKVALACVVYSDNNSDNKHGIEKLEILACKDEQTKKAYLLLKKIRHDRKIYEKTIDALMSNLSALQSLIKFSSPSI